MKRLATCMLSLLAISFALRAQPEPDEKTILCDSKRKAFLLRTAHTSYAFGVGERGRLVNLHWGGRIDRLDDVPLQLETHYFHMSHPTARSRANRCEYPSQSEGFYLEPSLKVARPEALADLWLFYKSHERRGNELTLELAATNYPFRVQLHYRVYPQWDLIDRWAVVQNDGPEKVVIENLLSAAWHVPHSHRYRLTHIAGEWACEWQLRHEFLEQGQKLLQSRTGVSGHYHVPFFALDQDGIATEKSGEVWFGTLQWSGNWKLCVTQDPWNQVSVCGGYNDFDFALELAAGASHATPVFTAGYTRGGFGEASRLLHRYQRETLCPENRRGVDVPIVYNTYGSIRRERVTEENVLALVPRAADIGVEMFIIDAGWQTAIGEWTVHAQKFPRGLKPVIDEVHRRGMKFGLWIEPERVMHDAKLFSDPAKQEWMFAKNKDSAMLNLARPDVLEYVHGQMADLLRQNAISYLKLDFNRYFDVPDVPDRRALWTDYTLNFYKLFERLRHEFPDVFFENCASGSGRPDLKMDEYFARINRSDNQDTLDCIKMQEAFTYLHPAYMAGGAGHISYDITRMMNSREAPFRFMAHVGMMGWLATSLPLDQATPDELAEVKGYFELFKQIRHVTCQGELHRLASLNDHPFAAFEFVLPDASEAVLFAFGHGLQFSERAPNFLLEALSPETLYDVNVSGAHPSPKDIYATKTKLPSRRLSGRALMEIGIPADLYGDCDSRVYHLRAVR